MATDAHQVFVSYSHADKAVALPIVDELQRRGVRLWIDRDGIKAGDWAEVIARAIRESDFAIVMASVASLASVDVQNEVSLAARHKKPFVPILLDITELSGALELWLSRWHQIYVLNKTVDRVADELMGALGQLSEEGVRTAPPAAPDVPPDPRVREGRENRNLERFRVGAMTEELAAEARRIGRALTTQEVRGRLEAKGLLPINLALVEMHLQGVWARIFEGDATAAYREALLAIEAGLLDEAEAHIERLFELDPRCALERKSELVQRLSEARQGTASAPPPPPSEIERALREADRHARKRRVLEAYRQLSQIALDAGAARHVARELEPLERALRVAEAKSRQQLPTGQILIPAGWHRSSTGDWLFLRTYTIDTGPVTRSAYRLFLDRNRKTRRKQRRDHEPQDHTPFGWSTNGVDDGAPVTGVSWFDAVAFAEWADRRLPSEAEWEKAALWDEEARALRPYPWGVAFEARLAMTSEAGLAGPQPVTSVGASAYGLQAAYGNVWEWCADGYDWHGAAGVDHTAGVHVAHVLRGGSWRETVDDLGAVWRSRAYPQCKLMDAGIRCATDVKLVFA